MWSCCYHITQSSLVKEHRTIDNFIVGCRHLIKVGYKSTGCWAGAENPWLYCRMLRWPPDFANGPLCGNPVRRAYPMQTTEFVIGNRDSLNFIGWLTTAFRFLRHFGSITNFRNFYSVKIISSTEFSILPRLCGLSTAPQNFYRRFQRLALTKPCRDDNGIFI